MAADESLHVITVTWVVHVTICKNKTCVAKQGLMSKFVEPQYVGKNRRETKVQAPAIERSSELLLPPPVFVDAQISGKPLLG